MEEFLDRPAAFLRRLGTTPADAVLPLAEAALACAVLDRHEPYPERDSLTGYVAHLAELAHAVGQEAHRGIAALPAVLAGKFGYIGDDETYDDLANADLMRVIDRRRGLPATLGILYLHAARAQGWQAVGLGFPSRFIIRVQSATEAMNFDPFGGGRPADSKEMGAIMAETGLRPEYMRPVRDRVVLLRAQNNIKSRLFAAQAYEKAEPVLERMLWVAPQDPALWRDAGMLAAMYHRYAEAIDALAKAVEFETDPVVRDGTEVVLRHLRSKLN